MTFLVSRQLPDESWQPLGGFRGESSTEALRAAQMQTGMSGDMLRVDGIATETLQVTIARLAMRYYASEGLEPRFMLSRLVVDEIARDMDEAAALVLREYGVTEL